MWTIPQIEILNVPHVSTCVGTMCARGGGSQPYGGWSLPPWVYGVCVTFSMNVHDFRLSLLPDTLLLANNLIINCNVKFKLSNSVIMHELGDFFYTSLAPHYEYVMNSRCKRVIVGRFMLLFREYNDIL
jgi:hypothetical protein